MFTRLATPILIALVVLGWQCGGAAGSDTGSASPSGKTPNDTKPAVNVCSLLTAEEIAAVTGVQVGDTDSATYGATKVCNYMPSGKIAPVVSLLLAPAGPVGNSAELAQRRNEQAKKGSYGNIKFIIEPIEGLGVPAIRNEIEGAGMVTVETVVKEKLFDVTTSSLEHSKALAVKAIARIP